MLLSQTDLAIHLNHSDYFELFDDVVNDVCGIPVLYTGEVERGHIRITEFSNMMPLCPDFNFCEDTVFNFRNYIETTNQPK